jgi:hypothetical protein
MPTWSELELMFLNPNIALWFADFVFFGGVPRYVIPTGVAGIDPHARFKEALAVKGGAIAEDFFKFGFGIVDSYQSYMLVHINPPKSIDGDFEYGSSGIVYSFASDIIFQRLMEKYQAQMLAGAANLFNCGAAIETYGAVSAGNLFEKICLWLKPLNGLHITAASLSGGADVIFDVPAARDLLCHDWKKTARLDANVLILPRISNLESGDAFFVQQSGSESFMMVIFQVTVGKTHPVKANGLKDILMAYPENVRNKITRKILVFVIPTHGTLDKEQKLRTQKDEEAVLLPIIVKNFQQYVYRHNICV